MTPSRSGGNDTVLADGVSNPPEHPICVRLDGSVAMSAGWCPRHCTGELLEISVVVAPAGYRFPREVIAVAVRWYFRRRDKSG
jgi:hypothetical protein